MKIFEIGPDLTNYQALITEKDDAFRTGELKFEGRPKADVWSPVPLRIYEPQLKPGTFVGLWATGAFAVREKSVPDELWTILEMCGELLPVKAREDEFLIWNITTCVNCLDHERTVTEFYKDGTPAYTRITKHVFMESMLPEVSVFKIPETRRGAIYACTERVGLEEYDFLRMVSEQKLEGLKLTLVYES